MCTRVCVCVCARARFNSGNQKKISKFLTGMNWERALSKYGQCGYISIVKIRDPKKM